MATNRPYVAVQLQGRQADVAALMDGIGRQFAPGSIHAYGHSFARPRHGPDHVSVHMRVTPAARPRRRLAQLLAAARPRRRSIPASMTPVRASIKPQQEGPATVRARRGGP